MKTKGILLFIISMALSYQGVSQLTLTSDPVGTNISEVDPIFSCGSPYDNVPIARSQGKKYVFENTTWPSDVFFGPDNIIEDLILGYNTSFTCIGLNDVTFNGGLSDLTNGKIVYTGTTAYPVIGISNVRFTMDFKTNPLNVNIPLDNTTYPGQIVFEVSEDFNVNVLIEAQITNSSVSQPGSGSCYGGGNVPYGWHPAVELFDRIGCYFTNCKPSNASICTSFDRSISLPFYLSNTCALNNTFDAGNGTDIWTDPDNWSSGCVPISPVSGNITIAANCSSLGSGAMIYDGDFIINAGIIFTNDDLNNWTLNGTLTNNGTMEAGDMMTMTNPFTNDGYLSGTITGTLINNGTFVGSVTGNCTNNGIVSPGN